MVHIKPDGDRALTKEAATSSRSSTSASPRSAAFGEVPGHISTLTSGDPRTAEQAFEAMLHAGRRLSPPQRD
jgi:hypothetical protein